jgi:hypothetical protein
VLNGPAITATSVDAVRRATPLFIMQRIQRLVLLLGVVALPALTPVRHGGAQTASAPSIPSDTASPGRWIASGDSLLAGSRVLLGTSRYRMTAYRDGDEFPVGRIQDVISLDTVNGVPMLRRVQQLQRGTQRILDSTLTEYATLAPRLHQSEQPNRRIGTEFNGRKIKVAMGVPGATPVVFDTTSRQPVFDSGNWDLLLRALPLEKGLRVRFLVYDTDAGIHEYRLAVTGSALIQGEEAHVVTFTLSRSSDAIVWVGKTSRELLQMETLLTGNTLLRQVRERAPATP